MGFTTAAALVHELMEARDERRLLNLQRQLSRLGLLIIDELGFVPLSPPGRNSSSRCSASATSGAHHGDHQPAFRRVDRGVRRGTHHRSAAGPAHPPRAHPGDERRATGSSAAGRTPPRNLQRSRKRHNAPSTPSLPTHVASATLPSVIMSVAHDSTVPVAQFLGAIDNSGVRTNPILPLD